MSRKVSKFQTVGSVALKVEHGSHNQAIIIDFPSLTNTQQPSHLTRLKNSFIGLIKANRQLIQAEIMRGKSFNQFSKLQTVLGFSICATIFATIIIFTS